MKACGERKKRWKGGEMREGKWKGGERGVNECLHDGECDL